MRPKTSEKGPRKSGPKAYARTKTERIMDCSNEFVTLRSWAIAGKAGATIDEVIGETKLNMDTVRVAIHFLFIVQFFGFSGSEGPVHVTYQ